MTQSYIEIIRFAASSLLCVDLNYKGHTSRVEPYSLRRTNKGNMILRAYNVNKNEHRSYLIGSIEEAKVTGQVFKPRFAIELTPAYPTIV